MNGEATNEIYIFSLHKINVKYFEYRLYIKFKTISTINLIISQWGSNLQPLIFQSNTLPLSQTLKHSTTEPLHILINTIKWTIRWHGKIICKRRAMNNLNVIEVLLNYSYSTYYYYIFVQSL